MDTKKLLKTLASVYPRTPDEEGMIVYYRVMSRWKISEDQTDALAERIISKHKYFPTVTEIITAAEELKLRIAVPAMDPHWILFSMNDQRWAKRVRDPSQPPLLPKNATNARLAVYGATNREEYGG